MADWLTALGITAAARAEVSAIETHRAQIVRRSQEQSPAGPQHSMNLAQRFQRLYDVLDRFAGDDGIEGAVGNWNLLDAADRPRHPTAAHIGRLPPAGARDAAPTSGPE